MNKSIIHIVCLFLFHPTFTDNGKERSELCASFLCTVHRSERSFLDNSYVRRTCRVVRTLFAWKYHEKSKVEVIFFNRSRFNFLRRSRWTLGALTSERNVFVTYREASNSKSLQRREHIVSLIVKKSLESTPRISFQISRRIVFQNLSYAIVWNFHAVCLALLLLRLVLDEPPLFVSLPTEKTIVRISSFGYFEYLDISSARRCGRILSRIERETIAPIMTRCRYSPMA